MATERQIAANRANAKRSTGPKTELGRARSSQNSLRHGLSLSLPQDVATSQQIRAVAGVLEQDFAPDLASGGLYGASNENDVMAFAAAQVELERIRQTRQNMLETIDLEHCDFQKLRRLAALDRYERRALTRRRRAADRLEE